MRRSFIDYAMSVIVSRAIPDVRDGLKPVHRRILYGMYEQGLSPTERYRKAAKTVGEVMGNYHPHGDSAIYEALVRLAQPGASRYVLIDGHGNFGDLDNPAAAMRYTEARLAPMSMDMLADIEAETVDTRPNFDDSKREPVVLPSRVPTLLLNGSSGIAVGMATNIPPHNLGEVIDGTIAKIDNPELTSEELMKYIKGPDFPSGGVIMGMEGIIEAYTTGRGSIPVRGVATIEQIPGGSGRQTRMGIVVTSLPYMIGPEAFAKRVAELVREEKISGISDVNDETDRTGIRVVIELKRDAHPDVVLNNLYKHTQLQQSFPVNTLALVRGRPATLKLADLLSEFIDHRIEVVTRRTKFLLRKAEDRAHILEGYLKALKKLDQVIATIRAAESTEEARQGLMEKFKLDEAQANAILEMQLRRLTGLERGKIEKEYAELTEKIAEYKKILGDRQLVLNIIKKELEEIRKKYADERRTRIEGQGSTDFDIKSLTANEPMAIFITKQDYIKRMPLDSFRRQRRNTRGVTGVKTKEEDDLQHFFTANMHDRLLVFTNRGVVYSVEVLDLPEGGRTARGLAIVNLLPIGQNETVTTVIPVSTFAEDSYFIMLTHQAFVKKVQMSDFANIRKSGIIAITLNDGDELGWVRPSNGKADVMIGTGDGMCIRYSEEELRPMGRAARGVRAITLREGDRIVGFDVIAPNEEAYALIVTNDGFGKRVKLEEFRQQGRGGIGLIGTKFKNAQSRMASLRVVRPGDGVMIATANGIVVRQEVDQISAQGRMATGVRIQQLGEEDQVVSVTPLVEPNVDVGEADSPPTGEAQD
ncbi:MAG: DNA gyrase subunit A [Candidatus Melainabacteria bacterium]|nr:MAG: DNA gyrase subunit A [Candidatus Melainabacteria bacterium]